MGSTILDEMGSQEQLNVEDIIKLKKIYHLVKDNMNVEREIPMNSMDAAKLNLEKKIARRQRIFHGLVRKKNALTFFEMASMEGKCRTSFIPAEEEKDESPNKMF